MFFQRDHNAPHVRPKAEVVIRRGESLLLVESADLATNEPFLYPPGSDVIFGQYAAQVVQSTVARMIGHGLTDIAYFATLESLYRRHGQRRHEVALIFTARFANEHSYGEPSFYVQSGGNTARGSWHDVEQLASSPESLQPNGLYALLEQSWDNVPTP